MLLTILALVAVIFADMCQDKKENLSKNHSTRTNGSRIKIYANAIEILFKPHNFYVEIVSFYIVIIMSIVG